MCLLLEAIIWLLKVCIVTLLLVSVLLRRNCGVFLHMDVAGIIFNKPSAEAFWMPYLHFVQFSGWLFGWTELTVPAIMPLLVSAAVSWSAYLQAQAFLWKSVFIYACDSKNHVSSQTGNLGTHFITLMPTHLVVRYAQLNLTLGFIW